MSVPPFARLCSALLLTLAACGSGDSGGKGAAGEDAGGAGCGGLCAGAGFSDGEEVDYGGGVVECQCAGAGDGIAADDCASYCADFGVGPDRSFVTSEVGVEDKCVCDGSGA
jgi:hypothetical protein